MDPLRNVIERLLAGVQGPGAAEALAAHRDGLLKAAGNGADAIAAYVSEAIAKHEQAVDALRRQLDDRTRG